MSQHCPSPPPLSPQPVGRFRILWRQLGLREHLALALIAVALLPVLILYGAQRYQLQADALEQTHQTLNLIADVQQRRINLELRRLEDLTRLIASRTQMRLSLAAYAQDQNATHLELITRILTDASQALPELRGIWIRDRAGHTLTQVVNAGTSVQALDAAQIPSPDAAPILLRRLATQQPELWLNRPLTLNEAVIGSVHLLVRLENIHALLEDFDHQYPGGETVLLLCNSAAVPFAWSARSGIWPLHTAPNTQLNAQLKRMACDAVPTAFTDTPAPHTDAATLIHTARALTLDGAQILVYTTARQMTQRARQQRTLLVYVTVSLLLLALGAAMLLARAIGNPIHSLTEGMRGLSQGDYHTRIREQGWGELWRLTHAFNETAQALQQAIQARLRSERELVTLANTDALTGLSNRRHFIERLTQHLECTRHASDSGALIYLDLDGFKPVNDQYGHDAGDAVLRIVAERLRRVVREQDQVGRLGGDEFAILVARLDRGFEPESVAKRLHETLNQPMTIQGHAVHVGCSLGMVRITPDSHPSQLLKAADAAMYQAKAGKARREA